MSFHREIITSVSVAVQAMGICGMIYRTFKKKTVFIACLSLARREREAKRVVKWTEKKKEAMEKTIQRMTTRKKVLSVPVVLGDSFEMNVL